MDFALPARMVGLKRVFASSAHEDRVEGLARQLSIAWDPHYD